MKPTLQIAFGFVLVSVPWWTVHWMFHVQWGPDAMERTIFFGGVPVLLLIAGFGLACIVKGAKEL